METIRRYARREEKRINDLMGELGTPMPRVVGARAFFVIHSSENRRWENTSHSWVDSEASSDSDPAEWPCTLLVWESSGRVSYDGNMVV
ncbi:hypothetical protein BDA96_06G068400 [Sorghum bicolor]|uniref:Uncharacterized protein n=2 Tax=Sorghum bicolor TaxID=4558 RepID=A0A921QRJ0_SORBI|nr:hypothetical protein BDA96_06G068400 [Sorghum bicolor]KAG0525577.1 hypothetical protein BDA96_06G068400 [Sorghum bicolor]KXG26178.1 hypothetical protein SORBI_3006G061800 [Sorghum bicolor]